MYKRDSKPDIYLVLGYTDFRCGINSLCYRLREVSDIDPTSSSLFVFMNKSKSQIKLLYYGGSGFWLLTYRPDKGKFRWLKKEGLVNITYKQLEWLLDGLDIYQKTYIEEVDKKILF